jgi:hypothetical protein
MGHKEQGKGELFNLKNKLKCILRKNEDKFKKRKRIKNYKKNLMNKNKETLVKY